MIERVLEIKKARGCAVLQLESGVLRVPLSLLRERPVRAGEVLDTQAYRLFIAQRGYTHALDHAVRLLSLCDRSENEVRRRLLDSGYPAACVDRVIEKLYEAELLDDEAYAQRWAQSRAHKHGRGRIERELTRRGVSREVAQSAVSELSDEEQLADAVRLTGKFLARTQGDFNRSLYSARWRCWRATAMTRISPGAPCKSSRRARMKRLTTGTMRNKSF